MRIAHFIYDDRENPWCGGGGAVRAHEVNLRLAKAHHVRVYTGCFPGAENTTKDGVEYIRLGVGRNYVISRLTYSIVASVWSVCVSSEVLVNDVSVFAPVFGALLRRNRFVSIIHHILGHRNLTKYPVLGLLPFFLEKTFVYLSPNILTVSPGTQECIRQIRRTRKRIEVITNGVDQKMFGIPYCEGVHLLYLGRFDFFMKGLDVLLDAYLKMICQNSKPPQLILAGRASKRDLDDAQRLCRERNLEEWVRIMPNISENKKLSLLRDALFLVLPSRFEGWGMVAIEAAAAGKMTVGSRIAGITNAVKEHETGILVEPEDSSQLAQKMSELIKNRKLRKSKAETCRSWARQFSWDKTAGQHENLYQSVADYPKN